jgi:phenylacetic acid degradation operon negative regulatory protein
VIGYRSAVTTTTRGSDIPRPASNPAAAGPVLSAAQPRQLIVTVYGLYARTGGGWMSVASVIALLGDLGVDQQTVRSAISRLKQRGLLVASKRGRTAGYELSAEAGAILVEGDHRIFEHRRAAAEDPWLLAVFSVPETERDKRHQLRSQLSRLGFGTVAAGVWIAPAHLRTVTADVLARHGLDGYADLFECTYVAFGEPCEKIQDWWDLDQLGRLYDEFLAAHRPVLAKWKRRRTRTKTVAGADTNTGTGTKSGTVRPGDGAEAFADYVRVLTDWRRLPYADPGLPAALLPADWEGTLAARLFADLRTRLEIPARQHAAAATATETATETAAGTSAPAR